MIKMIIKMNTEKIEQEGKYSINQIYSALDRIFKEKGMERTSAIDKLEYQGHDKPTDFAYFGRIMTGLKKQEWFMDNASVWLLCSNDDMDNPSEYNEEDLLLHYGIR